SSTSDDSTANEPSQPVRWPTTARKFPRRAGAESGSSLHPVRERVQVIQVHTFQRSMRTGTLTRGPPVTFHAQIALGRLANRLVIFAHHEFTALIADVHHANRVVGAIVRTGFAANASDRIDDDLPGERLAVDRTGWTTDHANGIRAVHAGVGDHQPPTRGPMPEEPGIIVMCRGARAHAIVAPRAPIQINHHRRRAV